MKYNKYRKKIKIKKKLMSLEKDLKNINNCKSPPDFKKNSYFLWYWNYFTLRAKKKNILVPLNNKQFLKYLWIFEILWNRFLYREKIFSLITEIKCFKW